jgi:hypothetical protein
MRIAALVAYALTRDASRLLAMHVFDGAACQDPKQSRDYKERFAFPHHEALGRTPEPV